jgi:hypothetical protein
MKPACRNGHVRTSTNTYTDRKGRVICRDCVRVSAARQYNRDYRATVKS